MFLGKALFLETYSFQNDYNFTQFGLSIGGICITGVIPDVHEKEALTTLRLTYEADILDTESYQLLEEAAVWGLSDKLSVVISIDDAPKSNENADAAQSAPAENTVFITRFLFDALLEKEKGVFAEEEDEDDEDEEAKEDAEEE